MAKKRTWPPCVKCGKAQGTRAGKLCSRCWKESLSGGGPATWKVADLKPHPLNAGIYGDGPDAALIDSVRRNGVLNALLTTPGGVIIAGHRRWRAAQAAGLDAVPVAVLHGLDDDAALEILVESNLQRFKSNEQIGREADALWPIHQRRIGPPVRLSQIPGSDLPDGQTRELVGAALGVAGITAERARAVVRHLDALEALDEHDAARTLRGELAGSIKGAWELMRSWTRPGMPADAPDVPAQQPEDKEAADTVFGPDGDWPSQLADKEFVDDLAGADLGRDDAPEELAAGLNELSQQIGDTAGRDEQAAGPRVVRLDPFGVPLSCQPGAEEAFATAEAMAELVDVFRAAGRAMTKIARRGGAELLRRRMKPVAGRSDDALRHVSVDAENAVLALTQTMPACCRCPECHSRGRPANDAGCGLCGGRPYVTAHQLAGVDQRLIDAMRRELAVPGKGAA